jgi:glycosyltransferase involved in cell wall biosynthesis
MRILIASHGHPAFSIGGAEVASYNLFRGLGRLSGCESHYLSRIGPPFAPHRDTPLMSLRQNGRETLFWANDYDYFLLANRDPDGLRRHLERFLKDLAPDIVHFHHVLGFGVQSLRSARAVLPDAPIVLTLHEYLSICHRHGQMVKTAGMQLCQRASPGECAVCFPEIAPAEFLRRELFLKSFYGLVDAFVGPSRFLLDRYAAWGLPAERLVYLENGLELGAAAPPRPLAHPGARRSRFAYFGQLNPFKGIKVLLEAVTRIPAEVWGQDSILYVFGGNLELQPPAFREQLGRLMRTAGQRVRFMGSYKGHELARLMREADWVIVPSTWWENSPVVIQEAFFHGRPVITSDIGGMAEKVRDRVDGLHFRAGSAESLADSLISALRDQGLWERLRARIRRPLSADEAAAQHRGLYARLLAGRRGATALAGDPGEPGSAKAVA